MSPGPPPPPSTVSDAAGVANGMSSSTAGRSTALRSSRTLPGHGCATSAQRSLGERRRRGARLGERAEVLDQHRDVVAALAQRRHAQRAPRPAGSRGPRGSVPRFTSSRRSRLVAAMTRTSTARLRRRRRGATSRSSSTRSSLGCSASGSSPISSRNRVPPSASSNAPARARSRAGERALLVAEQLGLEQVGRDGAAVDDDERPARARAGLVDRLAQHVLAGAGLALDQHGGVGGGDARQPARTAGASPSIAPTAGRSAPSRRAGARRIRPAPRSGPACARGPASHGAERTLRAPRRPRCGCRWSTPDRGAAAPWRSAG